MTNATIKELSSDNYPEALELVWKVFREFEAPDYSSEGVDEFYRSVCNEDYLSMLTMYGAVVDNKLVGIIATRCEGKHIALFFVDGKLHRMGIGRRLFETVKTDNMTVNSSPYAIPIYQKLGFKVSDNEQTVNGLRFTPMKLQLY